MTSIAASCDLAPSSLCQSKISLLQCPVGPKPGSAEGLNHITLGAAWWKEDRQEHEQLWKQVRTQTNLETSSPECRPCSRQWTEQGPLL